jgi:hypothetical protein
MFGFLFRSETRHIPIRVNGSTGHYLGGHMATKRSAGNVNPAWFAGDHSVVLGWEDPNQKLEPSSAEWFLPVDQATVKAAEGGILIVACERLHGGLHRRQANTAPDETDFKIFFNNSQKDGSLLLVKPPGYTDYFHRVPDDDVKELLKLIDASSIWPVPLCRTIYSWSINKDGLEIGKHQVVRIELAQQVLWDIDYVVLVLRKPKKELHPEVVKIIYLILGAVLTASGALLQRFLLR